MAGIPTKSQFLVQELQKKYGSANFRKWQSIRRQFYSFVAYPTTGVSEIRFFGSALGGSVGTGTANRQLTNMPKANSFGQNHFLLKAIRCTYYIPSEKKDSWQTLANQNDAGLGVTAEVMNGAFQAGVFELNIGSRNVVQVPKPALYMPPADGRAQCKQPGIWAVAAAPILAATVTNLGSFHAELNSHRKNLYLVDPNIIIEAEQNFECVIRYPSGILPLTGTTIINDSTNKLFMGIILDGLVFRPQQ